MQPSSIMGGTGPVQGVTPVSSLQTQMHSPEEQQQLTGQQTQQQHFPQQYDQAGQQQQHTQQNYDDFFEQMFSMPWDFNANHAAQTNGQKLLTMSLLTQQDTENGENLQYFEDPALLACRLRQHQLNGNVPINVQASQGINEAAAGNSPSRSMMLQLNTANGNSSQLLAAMGSSARGPVGSPPALPLSLGQGKPGDITEPRTRDDIVTNNGRDSNHGGLFPPFACATRGLRAPGPNFQPQVQMQGYAGLSHAAAQHPNPSPPPNAVGAPPTRPRVRARRGQATDPHSIAERLRRERIAERMKALQELVPNSNKTDKASMLDEIIDYVKFLQLQVKVLSMSRLGGAGAVAPLVADMPSEGSNGQVKSSGNGNDQNNSTPDGLALTERQVAKLMEEDMGSAMQYLQGKGLCLMPISLATAISSTNRSTQQQSSQHASPLQGLFTAQSAAAGAGNGSDRQQQQVEQANSSLSAISSIGSSNEANKSNAVPNMNSNSSNGLRSATTKEGNGNAIALKADDESQGRR